LATIKAKNRLAIDIPLVLPANRFLVTNTKSPFNRVYLVFQSSTFQKVVTPPESE